MGIQAGGRRFGQRDRAGGGTEGTRSRPSEPTSDARMEQREGRMVSTESNRGRQECSLRLPTGPRLASVPSRTATLGVGSFTTQALFSEAVTEAQRCRLSPCKLNTAGPCMAASPPRTKGLQSPLSVPRRAPRVPVPKAGGKETSARSPGWPAQDPAGRSRPSTVRGGRAQPSPALRHFWEKRSRKPASACRPEFKVIPRAPRASFAWRCGGGNAQAAPACGARR